MAARASAAHRIGTCGALEDHAVTEERLLERTKTAPLPLLGGTPAERASALERAYEIRGREIAWLPR